VNRVFSLLLILLPVLILIIYGKILLTSQEDVTALYDPKPIPQFQLLTLQGQEILPTEFDGISLLNVWASWCITCLVEHPFLTKLSQNNINLIGLNYKDSKSNAQQWLKKRGDPYKFSIHDPRGDLAFDLGVTGAPETFLVANQEIIGHIQGELNQEKWESIFVPLIRSIEAQNP